MYQLPLKGLLAKYSNKPNNSQVIIDLVDLETQKRRKKIATVSLIALAIVSVTVFLGIASSNKEQTVENVNVVDSKVDDVGQNDDDMDVTYPFPESIVLNDAAQHEITVMVDVSAYYSELKSLLEEHYQTDVQAIKLYSCLNGESTIQYLIWYDNSSDDYNMDQFASSSITQYLQGKSDTVSCNAFTSGFSDGVFIIYEN